MVVYSRGWSFHARTVFYSFSTIRFSRTSPEPLELQKTICIFLYPCLKNFQLNKNFSNLVTKHAKQLIFAKTHIFRKKSQQSEKNRHFENSRNFFHRKNRIYIQTRFQLKNHHATSSNQTRCVCHILMNQIYISCRNINQQIKIFSLTLFSPTQGFLIAKTSLCIYSIL